MACALLNNYDDENWRAKFWKTHLQEIGETGCVIHVCCKIRFKRPVRVLVCKTKLFQPFLRGKVPLSMFKYS